MNKIKSIGGINVSSVVTHYLIAALWATNDDDSEDGDCLDKNYSVLDCSDELIAQTYYDVIAFLQDNHEDCATWNGNSSVEEQTGHDLFLTRNHHGCGFWENEWDEPGQRLTEAAHKLGEVYLYALNGKVYA